MPIHVSQAEFARQQGWVKSYVTKLKQQGRLVMSENGTQVEVEASLQRIKATEDPNRDDLRARHKAQRDNPEQTPTPSENDASEERVTASYQKSRAVKEQYHALIAKTDYEKTIGKLVDAEKVKQGGFELGTHLRNALENLQDQLPAELAAETDENSIYQTLGEAFETLLTDLSQRINQLSKEEPTA